MKKRARESIEALKTRRFFKVLFSPAFSMSVSFILVFYNGVLGAMYHAVWHISICIYYLLLAGIRATVVFSQRKEAKMPFEKRSEHRKRIYLATHCVLVLMNVSLVVPITVMVRGERSYTFGLIPAIAMATYTTYRITMSIYHFKKSRKSPNILMAERRTINMIDSLVAVLSLQNTLIVANGGMTAEMSTLSAWTGAGIMALIVVITVLSFMKLRKL